MSNFTSKMHEFLGGIEGRQGMERKKERGRMEGKREETGRGEGRGKGKTKGKENGKEGKGRHNYMPRAPRARRPALNNEVRAAQLSDWQNSVLPCTILMIRPFLRILLMSAALTRMRELNGLNEMQCSAGHVWTVNSSLFMQQCVSDSSYDKTFWWSAFVLGRAKANSTQHILRNFLSNAHAAGVRGLHVLTNATASHHGAFMLCL